ncbi:hypothetical protein Tsubulata_022692 [Turnera subulata]|uniref:50S ribosomal protein 6, chloroplastic n=1 Tax=Turnera subulata TaxID=218843 RepID=A0A9Q0FAE5_9ROSI|nr:hypothetical protein Tsubulata_022692 [Turnera subulata]
MITSSVFGSPILLAPKSSPTITTFNPLYCSEFKPNPISKTGGGGGGFNGRLVIECSSRPKKKATAHHQKSRPKKYKLWDIKRKPTVYAPLPPLPPEWTIVSSADGAADAGVATQAASPSSPVLEAPPTIG